MRHVWTLLGGVAAALILGVSPTLFRVNTDASNIIGFAFVLTGADLWRWTFNRIWPEKR